MITAERLLELLDYDPHSGAFVRKVSWTNAVRAGEVAGTFTVNGYRQLKIDGRFYLAHVLAWLWMTGEMPARRITLRNGVKSDTRWNNLRLSGPEQNLTAGRVREIFDYNSETGIFIYRINRGGSKSKGDKAGFIAPNGYRLISINHHEYCAHRLAWLYVYGRMPAKNLDHINRLRDDNRILNLREATQSQNLANKTKQSNNTSGFKGVSWHKAARKWVACIKARGQYKYLGLFKTPESAHQAYCYAAYELFGEFASTS